MSQNRNMYNYYSRPFNLIFQPKNGFLHILMNFIIQLYISHLTTSQNFVKLSEMTYRRTIADESNCMFHSMDSNGKKLDHSKLLITHV